MQIAAKSNLLKEAFGGKPPDLATPWVLFFAKRIAPHYGGEEKTLAREIRQGTSTVLRGKRLLLIRQTAGARGKGRGPAAARAGRLAVRTLF